MQDYRAVLCIVTWLTLMVSGQRCAGHHSMLHEQTKLHAVAQTRLELSKTHT